MCELRSGKKPCITVSASHAGDGKNATPAVISAMTELSAAGGGTLTFEQGTYHFYAEGALPAFYAVSNNSAGEKHIVFPVRGDNGLTVDGAGATFVFHGIVFPFVLDGCRNVTLRNMVIDRALPHCANMRVRDVSDGGFGLEIDKKETPFYVKDGGLVFLREWGEHSGLEKIFSLHATERFLVRYLVTGDCKESTDNLPVPFMAVDASETEYGAYFTYRADTPSKCKFREGECIFSIMDGGRDADVIFLSECEGVRIENVTVRRGIGMGVIAQLSCDITVKGFRTDCDYRGESPTLTADALHFVNCGGRLEITECSISNTADDAVNVHGMYTKLEAVEENRISARIMHQEQRHFCPYRAGDRVTLIDRATLDVIGAFLVTAWRFAGGDGDRIVLDGAFEYGAEQVKNAADVLIENPDRAPDLHLHHNRFSSYPHLRISGGGHMVIENNVFENGMAAMLAMDLSDYWYESGRIRDLTFRNNVMDACNGLGGRSFITVGVSGYDTLEGKAPRIHRRVEISGNAFKGVKKHAIVADGVSELVIENNRFEKGTDAPVIVDGKARAL